MTSIFDLACEKCKNEKRKTINGDDLLHAMNTLGFEDYIDILKAYLQKYREVFISCSLILKYVQATKTNEKPEETPGIIILLKKVKLWSGGKKNQEGGIDGEDEDDEMSDKSDDIEDTGEVEGDQEHDNQNKQKINCNIQRKYLKRSRDYPILLG